MKREELERLIKPVKFPKDDYPWEIQLETGLYQIEGIALSETEGYYNVYRNAKTVASHIEAIEEAVSCIEWKHRQVLLSCFDIEE